jgi:hypothetical protein
MCPKFRSAKHRNSAFDLNLVVVRSEVVVLKWCPPYSQTPSLGTRVNKGIKRKGKEVRSPGHLKWLQLRSSW